MSRWYAHDERAGEDEKGLSPVITTGSPVMGQEDLARQVVREAAPCELVVHRLFFQGSHIGHERIHLICPEMQVRHWWMWLKKPSP